MRLGLGRLRYLNPPQPVQRYEWSRPGELVHMDTKKLGRIERPSHRVTGNRRDATRGAGWEYAHVAIDDCSRYTYVEILPDEKRYTANALLDAGACAPFRHRGIHIERVLTDNGGAYRSRPFRKACRWLGIADQTHATVPPADQRQSRARHPNLAAQMGLRRALRQLGTTVRGADAVGCASTMRNDPMLAFIAKHRLSRLAQFAEQRS